MEQSNDSSQFVPGSLLSLRRTSTGSLTSLKRSGRPHCSDYNQRFSYQSMNFHCRHTPIAGGSWDDNSVGHGSVAARMRRERNRAISQTKSSTSYVSSTKGTHANITSTLNLINTTSLSPWKQHDKFPWDDDFSMLDDTAASKRTAGSLCNIPASSASQPWDCHSVPDYQKAKSTKRTSYRNSFTSANYHSSPTSGCASMAGSDIDSSDLAFFSMTDDSSLFDGDSLFSDSYGVIEADSGFSTNIYSLLEEGTISCRTPFLNGDWPDSISELDFDCSEQQNDISNCDAHSDIGPSCSVPTERNRLKKRQVRLQDDQDDFADTFLVKPKVQDSASFLQPERSYHDLTSSSVMPMPVNGCKTPTDMSGLSPMQCSTTPLMPDTCTPAVRLDTFIPPIPELVLIKKVSEPPPVVPARIEKAASIKNMPPLRSLKPQQPFIPMRVDDESDNCTVVNCDVSAVSKNEALEVSLASNLIYWNNLPKEKKLGFVEQLSDRISKTMGLQEQLDIIHIIGANDKSHIPFHMSIDDIDSHKLSKVLGYLDTHRTVDSPAESDRQSTNNESNLRRSNSDGNLAKSVSEAQKEHRRRQRQARRFAKWLKQRQRKENRQHLKEQRSGLFVKEEKLKIRAEPEEDVEVEI